MTSSWFALGAAFGLILLGLVAAAALAHRVLSEPGGDASMAGIARAIREGAVMFLRRQYGTIAKFLAAIAALLALLHVLVTRSTSLALHTSLAFVLGGVCSAVAGWIGVQMAIRANVLTARAATESLDRALKVALRGGAVNALLVVGLALFGVATLYLSFGALDSAEAARDAPSLLVGYALGASTVALFAQLGGGIYTKAADMGADLVGKLDLGIPEDDPRNPAVIADLVGDNVGDCAGRGADLFESTAGECVGVMILAGALSGTMGVGSILFPLVTGALGILASLIGMLSVSSREDADPMLSLNRGYWLTAALAALGVTVAARWLLRADATPDAWWRFALAGIVGVVTAIGLSRVTEYYTQPRFAPLRGVSAQSGSGAATNVLAGFSLGLRCTFANTLVICAAVMSAYLLGAGTGVAQGGVFGIAVATSGMLGVAGYVLAMDTFGPIVDNAGGIVEMSGQAAAVRDRTDRLDACGNTTKAVTKGYAMGSAGLAAVVLIAAYLDNVAAARSARAPSDASAGGAPRAIFGIDFTEPAVFVAGLLGNMLVFYFAGLAIRAVGGAARAVIRDVRDQLAERPGIVSKGELPDYRRCVDIVTRAALRGMIRPTLVAVALPVAVALAFGPLEFAAEAVGAVLLNTTIAGLMLASVLNTSGAAWDNAKKVIELGAEGGRGSDAQRAAVVGDMVGDPFKDTAGPSLHVLIKTVAAVALTLAPFLG